MLIVGTKGYIELRRVLNITQDSSGGHVFVVTQEGEYHEKVTGKFPITYYHRVLEDVLHRTETAASQEHTFQAQSMAMGK